jgi:hypothetical protein
MVRTASRASRVMPRSMNSAVALIGWRARLPSALAFGATHECDASPHAPYRARHSVYPSTPGPAVAYSDTGRARGTGAPSLSEGGLNMGNGANRLRVQDLGLSRRDALLLLDALDGEAAGLDVAAEEVTPGTLAATILYAVQTATGGLRPGIAGSLNEYEALAARIAK